MVKIRIAMKFTELVRGAYRATEGQQTYAASNCTIMSLI